MLKYFSKNFLFIPIYFFVLFFYSNTESFPIPKDNKVKFDIIRKGKDIGDHIITFSNKGNKTIINVDVKIKVKIAFVVVYKFFHNSKEVWLNNKFVSFEGYTEFEDKRKYFIKANLNNDKFIASGMDGKLELSNNIITSNYWNMDVMFKDEIFDTQKGIVRILQVEELDEEEVFVFGSKIKCRKFILNASGNPKDKGPFAETTIWYDKNKELVKFQLKNPKDGVLITFIRGD